MTEKQKQKENYIDNKRFYEELVEYYNQEEPKKISNYLGECFLKICYRLSTRLNFSGYSYKDEMISDAIENCVSAINSFDPNKANNPFGYFSKIAWWAFCRRIQAEKKQQYIKHKNTEQYFLSGEIDYETNELADNVISEFEEKLKEKKNERASSSTSSD